MLCSQVQPPSLRWRNELSTFILAVKAEMFGLLTDEGSPCQYENLSVSTLTTEISLDKAFGGKHSINVPLLSDLHSLNVKVQCGSTGSFGQITRQNSFTKSLLYLCK